MHHPVLLHETIASLGIVKQGKYIDATAGEGGHLKELAAHASAVLAIDRDEAQINALRKQFAEKKNISFAVGNFAEIETTARTFDFLEVSGIIFDLGLSMKQLGESGKGLSYKKWDEPLDMRLNEQELSAATIVNTFGERELYEMFAKNAEEVHSEVISQTIVQNRGRKRIETVGDLIECIDQATGKSDASTYARVFQALRMEVNQELENLKKGLEGAMHIIAKEGRIAVITFHSVEDRLVKQFIRDRGLRQMHKKAIVSGSGMAFERSAKLRVFSQL